MVRQGEGENSRTTAVLIEMKLNNCILRNNVTLIAIHSWVSAGWQEALKHPLHFFSQKDLQKSLNIYSSALKQDTHETTLLEGAHTFWTGTQIRCLTMPAPLCISTLYSDLISGVIYLLFKTWLLWISEAKWNVKHNEKADNHVNTDCYLTPAC